MKRLGGRGPVTRDWFGLDVFQPGPRFTRSGSSLYLLEEVGSTNEFLLGKGGTAEGRVCRLDAWGWSAEARRTLDPLPEIRPGLVVVARRQTAGHGRQGRRWLDCGGLNMSVVVPAHRAAFDRGFSVWLGLMVVLSLREEFNVDARLKWPNDIMCAGRKLGGILLENHHYAKGPAIIAGLGLNLDTGAGGFPGVLQGRATSIQRETGRQVRRGDVAGSILSRVEGEIDRFDQLGWQPWRPSLECLDCLLGSPLELQMGRETVTGRGAGLDDTGNLLLDRGPAGLEAFAAGEVHVLRHQSGDPQEENS